MEQSGRIRESRRQSYRNAIVNCIPNAAGKSQIHNPL